MKTLSLLAIELHSEPDDKRRLRYPNNYVRIHSRQRHTVATIIVISDAVVVIINYRKLVAPINIFAKFWQHSTNTVTKCRTTKMCFSTNILLYLGNHMRHRRSYYVLLTESDTCSIKWWHNQESPLKANSAISNLFSTNMLKYIHIIPNIQSETIQVLCDPLTLVLEDCITSFTLHKLLSSNILEQ